MLEFRAVDRYYGDRVALRQLSFTVPRAKIVGLLGPNGAGKTTAMRAALGITTPDHGEVLWKGEELSDQTRSVIGYLPEERGLYPAMRVREQLTYIARLHGVTKSCAKAQAEAWMSRLAIADRASDRVESLSLGNQQRVQLAAALVHDPTLLILDEPFSGLDPYGIEDCGQILREQAALGKAVLFSSHQLDLVEHFCDSVVIVNQGEVVVAGDLADLTAPVPGVFVVEADDAVSQDTLPADVALVGQDQLADGVWRVRLHIADRHKVQPALVALMQRHQVNRFDQPRRRLSDVFREAVAGTISVPSAQRPTPEPEPTS